MNYFQLFPVTLGVTFLGVIALFFLPSHLASRWSAILVILNSILSSLPAVIVLKGITLEMTLAGSAFFGHIPFRMDALSALFILIINFTSVNAAIYGIGYMKAYHEEKKSLSLHWFVYPLFHTSMLWVCIVQHSMAFLIVWEVMSLTSFLLVMFEYQKKKTLHAGINYLVQMHIGIILLSLGFIWVYISTGTYDFKGIELFFSKNPNIWLFLVFFTGFGIKAGFIPFHTWLPQAHPAAPSHISGVMSGVMVKLGIFGIFRVATCVKHDFYLIGEIVLGISLLSGLYGIFNASVHRNYKKMLAFCTIENIGIIGMGLGLGLIGLGNGNKLLVVAGFTGALFHTLNHSLFKSLLFFSAGSVYQQTHTKNMEKLGGLLRKMPHTAWIFLLGSLAIGGLPPFNGFISEFILYRGFLEGVKSTGFYLITLMILSITSLAIIGGLSLIAFTKGFGTIFLGTPRTLLKHEPTEVSGIMRIPQYGILLVMISIGVFPQWYFGISLNAVSSLFHLQGIIPDTSMHSTLSILSLTGRYSLLLFALIILVYGIRSLIAKQHNEFIQPTWGCGYTAPRPSMQYTGKSYSKSLTKLVGMVVSEEKNYSEIPASEIFPATRKYSTLNADSFTNYINKFSDGLVHSLNYFQFIQNGNIQMYILYGLIFILLVFLGSLFNFI